MIISAVVLWSATWGQASFPYTGEIVVDDESLRSAGSVMVYNADDDGVMSTTLVADYSSHVQLTPQAVITECQYFPPATPSLRGSFDVHAIYGCSHNTSSASPSIDLLAGRIARRGPCGNSVLCLSNYALISVGGKWAGSASITVRTQDIVDEASVFFPLDQYEVIHLIIAVDTAEVADYTVAMKVFGATGDLLSQRSVLTTVVDPPIGMTIITAEAAAARGKNGYAVFAHASIIPANNFCLSPLPLPSPDLRVEAFAHTGAYAGYRAERPVAFGIGPTCDAFIHTVELR